jgi:hypothetical protein
VIIKSEVARTGEVSIALEGPDGKADKVLGPTSVNLKGGSHGHYLKVPVSVHASVVMPDGVYWFNVFWGEELIQRTPMDLRRERFSLESGSQSPERKQEAQTLPEEQ